MPVTLQRTSGSPPPSLADLLERSRLESLLIVVPTRRRIRHLSREVLAMADRGISPALPIHTLETLAVSIVQASSRARPPLSTALQSLLFDRAIRDSADILRYFSLRGSERRMFPGTFETLINVVTLLKESGLTPDLLDEEADEAPPEEQGKLRDVAAIFRAFDRHLEEAAVADTAGVYRWLTRDCSRGEFIGIFRRVYPHVAALSVAGFDQFTPPEMDFLESLAGVPGVALSLRFDFQHGNPKLFGHLEENYRRFLRLGFVELGDAEGRDPLDSGRRTRPPEADQVISGLGRRLFLRQPSGTRRIPGGGRVRILEARTRSEEIASICKIIKVLVADRPDRDLSRICVAMVRPQRYTEIAREEFDRFGIPANITDRYSLHRSPLIASIVGLLQMVGRGYAREDVLRVLASPYFEITTEPERDAIARVATALRITAGERLWRERIEAARRDPWLLGAGRSLPDEDRKRLDRASHGIQRLVERTAALGRRQTPGAFESQLVRTLESVGLPGRLLPGEDRARVERDVRAYARFLEVLRETVRTMERQDGPSHTRSLRTLTETLRLAVMRERYSVREEPGQGVLVTSIDETRGLAMDVMVVAGLVDGEFPSAYAPEVFLSAGRQREREQWHLWQERYLFYQAAANWSESLILSYPAVDGEIELVRSPFVEEMLSVVDARPVETETLRDLLCSADEVLSWHAAQGRYDPGAPDGLSARIVEGIQEIGRVAAIERSRTSAHDLPQFEGMVGRAVDDATRTWLEEKRHAVYSVSQLETYAACPFRYFADRLLQLEVPDEFTEEWTARERGALIHRILYEFHLERRTRALPPLPACTREEFEQALGRIRDIATRMLAPLDLPDPFWSFEREFLLGVEGGAPGVLEEFLALERARRADPVPRFFEVTFGGGGDIRDPDVDWPEAIPLGGVRLRGRIDRIDVANDHFTVVDYKTGMKVPTRSEMEDGLSLQLPLYLQAAETILASFGHAALAPAAGIYHQVRKPPRIRVALGREELADRAFSSGESSPTALADEGELRALFERSAARAGTCTAGIAGGVFPLTDPSRAGTVCRSCPFKTMCRIQAQRRVTPAGSEGA